MINKEFNLDKFKKQSAKVSGFLNEKGHAIPKSTLLHALSIFLEEKNWNTLSAKFEDQKSNNIALKNPDLGMKILNEDCVLILNYIYYEIFYKHFPVKSKKLLNENLTNIVNDILIPDGMYPPRSRPLPATSSESLFPDVEFLVKDMHLIGDEQILKISFSYNEKINTSFPNYPLFNLFDFLRSAIYLMTKPDVITGSDLGNNILGVTKHVCLQSRHRSKAYFFIPLSIKENFVENSFYNSSSASSMNLRKHSESNHVKEHIKYNIAETLLLLGIEDIEFNSCFLNEPYINDFLKTR